MCAYAVHSGPLHQITKYNGNCKRQISHQSNTDYFASIFFLINSTEHDLHRPSRYRVYVFLLDISRRTIYSFIYITSNCTQVWARNKANATAVKPWLWTCCRMCNIKRDLEEKTKKYVTCDTPANVGLFLNSFDPPYFVPAYDQLAISDLYTQTIMIEFTFSVHD